jgi:hypothetical protein
MAEQLAKDGLFFSSICEITLLSPISAQMPELGG